MVMTLDFEKSPRLDTAIGVIIGCLTSPRATFAAIDPAGRVGPALALGIVLWWVGFGLELSSIRSDLMELADHPPEGVKPAVAWFRQAAKPAGAWLRKEATARGLESWVSPMETAATAPWLSMWLVGFPVVVCGTILATAGLHLCLFLVGAGAGGFAATLRVGCYSGSCALLAPVPLVGPLLSLIVVSIQQLTGLSTVHRTTVARVAVGLCLPLVAAAFALVAVAWWALGAIR